MQDQLKLESNGGSNSNDLMLCMTEDTMDSVGSADFTNTSSPIPSSGHGLSTPATTNKRPAAFTGGKSGKKVITGYILYSSEVRKSKVVEHPECKFGEISRMIGDEWRALPQNERRQWESRASKINDDNANKYAEDMALNGVSCNSPGPSLLATPLQLSLAHEFIQNQVIFHNTIIYPTILELLTDQRDIQCLPFLCFIILFSSLHLWLQQLPLFWSCIKPAKSDLLSFD